jgi:hypothetical protein
MSGTGIPAGATMYIGPPAKPMPKEIQQGIANALANVPEVLEAHLPQCYIQGYIDPSAQVLVLVLQANSSPGVIVPRLQERLTAVLPTGTFLDIWPVPENHPMLENVRMAGCMLKQRSNIRQ